MADNNNSNAGGVGFFTILFVVFLILKLTHTINWSWWWVTAPLWLPGAILLVIVTLVSLVILIKRSF